MYYTSQRCYENCEKEIFSGVGEYDIPELQPAKIEKLEDVPLIGFNYVLGEKHPEDKIAHFYLDDYQFDRVWNKPERYINLLKKFKAVLSPDFSLYTDFPKALQIYNHYRKQWLGAYFQQNGIDVIPTVGWSDEESFNWCLDGIPRHALVSISTVGSFGNYGKPKEWIESFNKAVDILKPSHILLYGKKYPEIEIPCPYTVAVNQNTLNRKLARQRMDAEAKENGD